MLRKYNNLYDESLHHTQNLLLFSQWQAHFQGYLLDSLPRVSDQGL